MWSLYVEYIISVMEFTCAMWQIYFFMGTSESYYSYIFILIIILILLCVWLIPVKSSMSPSATIVSVVIYGQISSVVMALFLVQVINSVVI